MAPPALIHRGKRARRARTLFVAIRRVLWQAFRAAGTQRPTALALGPTPVLSRKPWAPAARPKGAPLRWTSRHFRACLGTLCLSAR